MAQNMNERYPKVTVFIIAHNVTQQVLWIGYRVIHEIGQMGIVAQEDERERIRQAMHRCVVQDHIWKRRRANAFRMMGLSS